MKILKIALKNVNSLKTEVRINFQESPLIDTGLFAIVGDTGAGKTSILDALTLALYGKVHRNKNEGEVLSFGATDGYAEVEYQVKANKYRSKWMIRRARKKLDGNLLIDRELAQWKEEKKDFLVLTSKIREIERQTEAITGLDYHRFSKSVLLSQGDFAAFLKAGEKDRSNLLERITGTEIYSRISTAAFERFRSEEEKYNELKKEIAALQILDSAAQKDIEQELRQIEKESQVKQTELDDLKKEIQLRVETEELAKTLQQEQTALEQTQETWSLAQPNFNRLELHKKTLVFQKDLLQLQHLDATQNQITTDKQRLQEKIKIYQQQKEQAASATTKNLETLQRAKRELIEKEKLFEQVLALDVQLTEKKRPITQSTNQLKKLQAHYQQYTNQQKVLKEELNQKKETQIVTADWLKENKIFDTLSVDIPFLERQKKELSKLFKTLKATEEEQRRVQQNLAKIQQHIVAIGEEISSSTKEQEQIQVLIRQQFPDFQGEETQLLGIINEQLEQVEEQMQTIENLRELNGEYQQLINDLNVFEEEIAHLEANQRTVDGRLLTAREQRDQLQAHRQYKLQMFEREQLFANYERERANLKEGEKCPLCLSTMHPFRTLTDFTPYVDKTKEELEVAEAQLQLVQKEYEKLLNYQNDIRANILQYIGEREEELGGKREMILRQIHIQENKFAKIAPRLNNEAVYHTKSYQLQMMEKEATQARDAKKILRQRLLDWTDKQASQLKLQRQQQQQTQEYQVQFAKLKSKEENYQVRINEIEQKIDLLKNEISQRLLPYNYDLNNKNFQTSLSELKEQHQLLITKQQQLPELEKEIAVLEQQFQQVQQHLDQLTQEQQTHQVEHQSIVSVFNNITQERTALFGAKVPKEEKEKLLNQVNQLETTLANLQQRLKEAEIDLTTTQRAIDTLNTAETKNQSALTTLQNKLQSSIVQQGFASVEEVQIAHLTNEILQQIEQQKESLQKQLTVQEQQVNSIQKALTKIKEKQQNQLLLPTLQEQYQAQETMLRDMQQSIGRHKQRLEVNETRKIKSQSLIASMEVQEKEFSRWKKLQDLIGSRDGKKFRVFAQGLTLKKLTGLANRHLKQLNGRYLLNKPNDRDLDLEIVDTYQADNIRSVNTLSGGESFLVSLALALGLSDLAGRNTQIQSLFIDEGFGTLDESALDLAISTLENLQADGKTIGVISHIKELKERITTQIQIQKTSSGFSEVKIV